MNNHENESSRMGYNGWDNKPVKNQKWISVKDRLPEDDTIVLIYDSLSKLVCDCLFYLGEWEAGDGIEVEPAFWQPLPEPPEEA